MKRTNLSLAAITLSTLLGACSDSNNDPQSVDAVVNFSARVGSEDFVSGTTYTSFGAGSTSPTQEFTINDFRMYISSITLKTDTNEEVPVTLTQDGTWQYENVALLDFETTATPETNTGITGSFTKPSSGTINQVCFDVGVPFALNHLNTADAPSPLNASGMMWIWQSGHKFIRIDGKGDPNGSNIGYNLHLGSTGCVSNAATEAPTAACTYSNLPHVCLDTFNIDNKQVVIDLANLFANTDITQVTANTAPGCMSGNNDPECQTLLPRLGLDFVYNDGVNPAQTFSATDQAMFSVESM
jgi:uncharacterized repeat protein (TIGR04052 family)